MRMKSETKVVIFGAAVGAVVGGVIAAVSYKFGCTYTEHCIAMGLEKFYEEGFLKFFDEYGRELASVEDVMEAIERTGK